MTRYRGLLRRVRSGNGRGQSLVEFALCTVALLALILGVVEFGRVIVAYATIASSARVGSRYATVNSSVPGATVTNQDVAAIKANVALVVNSYLPGANVIVAFPTGTLPGNPVQVTVSYSYIPLISYFGMQFALASTSEGMITW
jgi:Flp pilus assembly protein TadG